MSRPPMVIYKTEAEYFEHYKNIYCRNAIYTSDNIRVYFRENMFKHAFSECVDKSNPKSKLNSRFNLLRARYINWIKYTLESPDSKLYQGYDNNNKTVMPHRRVAVVNNDKYRVVIEMFYKGDVLCAQFRTAFYADNSYNSIKKSPVWSLEECKKQLKPKDKK